MGLLLHVIWVIVLVYLAIWVVGGLVGGLVGAIAWVHTTLSRLFGLPLGLGMPYRRDCDTSGTVYWVIGILLVYLYLYATR